MADSEITPSGCHPQPLSLEHELAELADQIQALLFLSEGDVTAAQLADYSEQFTHILRYGRALGYHAAFLWKDGEMVIEWQPISAGVQ